MKGYLNDKDFFTWCHYFTYGVIFCIWVIFYAHGVNFYLHTTVIVQDPQNSVYYNGNVDLDTALPIISVPVISNQIALWVVQLGILKSEITSTKFNIFKNKIRKIICKYRKLYIDLNN